jgi:hypothetical protein
MLADQREQFEVQRQEIMEEAEQRVRDVSNRSREQDKVPKRVETAIAEERSLREDLERTLQIVMQERDAARNELLSWSMKNNLSREENKSLEEQRKLMRDEFERAQRNAEGAIREQRASERRFEALAEEMRQVMEERDQAYAARDEARKQKADEERHGQEARRQADEAIAMNAALAERLQGAERAREAAVAQRQSEERLRSQAEADIEVFRQQAHTLQVERDAALRENESVLERLDQAIGARRLAVAARAEAVKQAEEAAKKCEMADAKLKAETKRADEMEGKAREAIEEAEKIQQRLAQQTGELRDAHEAVQEYKDLKEEAERECEAARRQVRGLNEEMLSVLKARDLALQQRDEAFARPKPPQLLEDVNTRSARPTTTDQPLLLRDVEEMRAIMRASLTSLMQMESESPTKSQQPPPPPPPPIESAPDIASSIQAAKADASELALRISSYRDKNRSLVHAQREASRKAQALEAMLRNTESGVESMAQELNDLRKRAAETEQALRQAPSANVSSTIENLRNQLRERTAEVAALQEERQALYLEVKELNYQIARSTPQRRELENLKEKLEQVLSDFDQVEAENRRLKGL